MLINDRQFTGKYYVYNITTLHTLNRSHTKRDHPEFVCAANVLLMIFFKGLKLLLNMYSSFHYQFLYV